MSLNFPIIKLEQPEYLKLNDEIIKNSYTLKFKINRAKRFFSKENVEKNDPSVIYNLKHRLRKGLKEEVNRYTYKLLKTVHIDALKDKLEHNVKISSVFSDSTAITKDRERNLKKIDLSGFIKDGILSRKMKKNITRMIFSKR